MFRDTQRVALDVKNFGVGSTIVEGHNLYLVVCQSTTCYIMDCRTFEIVEGSGVVVQDPNFLSSEEAHGLIKTLGCTRSDCDWHPSGLKALDMKAPSKRQTFNGNGVGITKM